MRVLNYAQARLFDFLDCTVRKDAFFLTVSEEALNSAVREADLFRTVREVLLNLIVLELKNL